MGSFNTTTLVDPFATSPEHGKMQYTVVYNAFQCVENVIRFEGLGFGPTVEGYKKKCIDSFQDTFWNHKTRITFSLS